MAQKGKGRKLGNKKKKPAYGRWKTRFNLGLGLKHRRAKRRAALERAYNEGRVAHRV
jgi:hypothetical protein